MKITQSEIDLLKSFETMTASKEDPEVSTVPQKTILHDIIVGGRKAGSKYLARMGTPGHYLYSYPTKQVLGWTPKMRFAYARFFKKSRSFLQNLGVKFQASAIVTKPKTWTTAIVNMRSRSGDLFQFNVNLQTQKVVSFKTYKPTIGGSTALAKQKKAGQLR